VIEEVVKIWLELSPWFLLGMLISGLLHGFVPKDFMKRQLRGRWGPIKAVALGVPLPLCSCGVIPTAVGLKKDGASNGSAIGFLISTPQTGVDSILVSASFLGWPFALFKVLSAAVTGIVGGLLTHAWGEGGRDEDGEPTTPGFEKAEEKQSGRVPISEMASHAMEVLGTIWHWLIIGVIVSAAISTFIPESLWQSVSSWGFLGSASVVLLISVPLYVCATASVPIAAALVAGGMPLGAALVFLMAGPATNLATMGTILRSFGRRVFMIYLGTIIIGSMALGKMFDFVLDPSVVPMAHEHVSGHWVELLGGILLLTFVLYYAFVDLRKWVSYRSASTINAGDKTDVSIEGMTCGGCVNKVHRAIAGVDGVQSVDVNLDPGNAIIVGRFDMDQVQQVISNAGFHMRR
jgi:uncharacterized membrane protein YraQ (UPF0718 family)/copper chaperone CopZ